MNYSVVFITSSLAIACIIVNLVYIIVCFKALRSTFYHLLILTLCFSDSLLTFSVLLYGLVPLFEFLQKDPFACACQLFLIFFGIFLNYLILFLLCVQRFYVLLTNNFGSRQQKFEKYRYQIVVCFICCLFCYETALFVFVPKTNTFDYCSVPNMFTVYGSLFTGLNIVPVTIIMVFLVLLYLSASRIIWKKFFNAKVRPICTNTDIKVVKPNLLLVEERSSPSSQSIDKFRMTDATVRYVRSSETKKQRNIDSLQEKNESFDIESGNIDTIGQTCYRPLSKAPCTQDKCSVSGIVVDIINAKNDIMIHPIASNGVIHVAPSWTVAQSSLDLSARTEIMDPNVSNKRNSSVIQCSCLETPKNANNTDSQNNKRAQLSKWEIRAFITCVLIACQTILLTGPIIFGFWFDVVSSRPLGLQIKFILSIPYFLNSLSNPIMYTWRIEEIRKAFKKVCNRSASNT